MRFFTVAGNATVQNDKETCHFRECSAPVYWRCDETSQGIII